jgi:hypothetical protein
MILPFFMRIAWTGESMGWVNPVLETISAMGKFLSYASIEKVRFGKAPRAPSWRLLTMPPGFLRPKSYAPITGARV